MKILLAGNFKYYHYEQAAVDSLRRQNCEVSCFSFRNYIKGYLGKIEEHFNVFGPQTLMANYLLYKNILSKNPDCVIIWRGIFVSPFILKRIKKKSSITLISYNNDDPFSLKYYERGNINQKRLWNRFKRTIPYYDINLVYRPHNIKDYQNHGSSKTLLFPPYYIPNQIEPLLKTTSPKKYDITFIGHFEEERLEVINYLLENNIKVRIFGPRWNRSRVSEKYQYGEIKPIFGDDYFKTIIESKVCLAFLSKLNRDVYTRRNFEIPGCGTCMLSERTEELTEMFIPNKDALFFSNKEEALSQARIALANYIAIGESGKERVKEIGGDIDSSFSKLLKEIEAHNE